MQEFAGVTDAALSLAEEGTMLGGRDVAKTRIKAEDGKQRERELR